MKVNRFTSAVVGFGGLILSLMCSVVVAADMFEHTSGSQVVYGVYGKKWAPWVEKNREFVSLFIYQMPLKPTDSDIAEVERLLMSEIDMFFVQGIHHSRLERWKQRGARSDKSYDEVGQLIKNNYVSLKRNKPIKLSLDEENIWWKGRGGYLNDIYSYLKSGDSDLDIWQFFAEGKRTQRRQDRLERFRLSADGYIFDEYSMPPDKYENLLREYVSQGKPVISILWASPNWKPSSRKARKHDLAWWDREGWRSFYAKTMINRKYGVSTGYFIYDIGGQPDKFRLIPSFIGSDECSVLFVEKLFSVTLPKLFSMPVDTSVPTVMPGWVSERCPAK